MNNIRSPLEKICERISRTCHYVKTKFAGKPKTWSRQTSIILLEKKRKSKTINVLSLICRHVIVSVHLLWLYILYSTVLNTIRNKCFIFRDTVWQFWNKDFNGACLFFILLSFMCNHSVVEQTLIIMSQCNITISFLVFQHFAKIESWKTLAVKHTSVFAT